MGHFLVFVGFFRFFIFYRKGQKKLSK
jgi:hypothetical protein